MGQPIVKDITKWKEEARNILLYEPSEEVQLEGLTLKRDRINAYESEKQARMLLVSEDLINQWSKEMREALLPTISEVRNAQMRLDGYARNQFLKAIQLQAMNSEEKKKGGILGFLGIGRKDAVA